MAVFEDVQGLVVDSYKHLRYAAFLPFRAADNTKLREALGDLLPSLTCGIIADEATRATNVALSGSAIRKLGLEDRTLREFSVPFLEGMAGSEHRSRDLGDIEASDPELWDWGKPDEPVDVLLLLYDAKRESLKESIDAAKTAAKTRGLSLVTPGPLMAAWPKADGVEGAREHFGFVDGISQPKLDLGKPQPPGQPLDVLLAPGELLLGHLNERGIVARGPTVSSSEAARRSKLTSVPNTPRFDLGRDGTYLVFRQLEQMVLKFWAFANAHADVVGSMELCAAKLMGRWRNGAPLIRRPENSTPPANQNDFHFRDDERGMQCPIGAHIRRANPRDTLHGLPPRKSLAEVQRHRILRRGRPYGDKVAGWPDPVKMLAQAGAPDGGRGMHFIAINADIAEQFERIQQRWLNDPTFINPANAEVDPIVGRTRERSRFIVPREPTPVLLGEHGTPCERFVTTRGGGYFFLPSKRALMYLAATDR